MIYYQLFCEHQLKKNIFQSEISLYQSVNQSLFVRCLITSKDVTIEKKKTKKTQTQNLSESCLPSVSGVGSMLDRVLPWDPDLLLPFNQYQQWGCGGDGRRSRNEAGVGGA